MGHDMARKKQSGGVVATIERLTEKMPCPEYLRVALNKYLYQEELFERPKGNTARGGKKLGKLNAPDTDNLVRNVLDLDALFGGDTSTVVDIVAGTIDTKVLNGKLDDVERSMQDRLAIYGYWLDRIASARAILAVPGTNWKTVRLDEKLLVASRTDDTTIPAFALHALSVQEASEAKGRRGVPSAAEYVERGEAYLALDDMENADRNACLAIAQDASIGRGWFLRIAIALRRRKSALKAYARKRMEAQEMAEPMSAHERWALEQADDAGSDAWAHQQSLDALLPEAVLHWPMRSGRRDHTDLWRQVRNIFIERMFSMAVHDVGRAGTRQQLARQNGLEPEWEHEHRKNPHSSSTGRNDGTVFTTAEAQALAVILAEYDAKPSQFFDAIADRRLATGFCLFHLRYVSGSKGCDVHWNQLQTTVADTPASWQHDQLFRDPAIARLWQVHYCHRAGAGALMDFNRQWLEQSEALSNSRLQHTLLQQFAYLYHHQFVRREFGVCGDIALQAIAVFKSNAALTGWFGGQEHPCDTSISMPVHRCRYWQYLAAIAAVEQRRHDQALSAPAAAILDDQESWRALFAEQATCFWTESEEYDEGGGDDWLVPPYDIDLGKLEGWVDRSRTEIFFV